MKCGDDGLKDTPVPMPNTEVKLQHAKSSWGIAPCEDRTLPRDYSGIAQLVEHLTVNQVVVSSSLTAGVNSKGLVMIRQSLFLVPASSKWWHFDLFPHIINFVRIR